MYLPLFVGFALVIITLCASIDEEERAGCFAFIVFWILATVNIL